MGEIAQPSNSPTSGLNAQVKTELEGQDAWPSSYPLYREVKNEAKKTFWAEMALK